MKKSMLDKKEIMDFDFQIAKSEPAHFHQNIEILYLLEGNVRVNIDNNSYDAVPEDILVVNADKKHSYQSSGDVLIGSFKINYQMLREILGTNQILFWCNSIVNKNTAYDALRSVMKQIFNQYSDKKGQNLIVLRSLYYKLLHILVAHFLVCNDDQRFLSNRVPDENRKAEIISFIQANYNRRLSLNELAEHLFLSVPYLSKYIKQKLGMNYVDYVNRIRLFHAVDDLLNTNKSIIEIVLNNGFANTAAFDELFKKIYGATPSDYRRKMRTSIQRGEEQPEKQQKEINKRVNAYLENTALESPVKASKGNDYMMLDAQKKQPYKQYWRKMINAGRTGDLLRSDMQEHILTMKREIGFEYIRFWDIFSEDMQINESNDNGKYNFEKLDKILDFLVGNGIYPYIEMGYKPKNLHSTLMKTIVSEKRNIAFQSLESYQRFLTAFVTNITNRYGVEEIEKWYFEQWGGEDFEKGSGYENYYSIFGALYKALKKISPKIKVGGSGIGIQYGSGNLVRLVCTWGQQNYIPDFLSLYCYPYNKGVEDGVSYAKMSTDRNFLKNQLVMASSIIKKSRLKNCEIHVSEWSFTISNRNTLNDSCFKGAYVMKNIIDNIGMTDVLGYWVASDIFSENCDNSQLLFGGCGLLSRDGIKKPAYYAYFFLNSLGKYLIYTDQNSIVTTNGYNNYYIACHNYRHLNYKYYLKSEDEIEISKQFQMFEDDEVLQLNYQLANVKNGKYKIKTYAINDKNGSVQEEWRKMGMSDHLTKQEVEYFNRICIPSIQIAECKVINGVLNFEVCMRPQEIQYLHISYLFE